MSCISIDENGLDDDIKPVICDSKPAVNNIAPSLPPAKRERRQSIESPFELAQPLYPHQCEAVAWMLERESGANAPSRGGILADEQGLGKTVSAIALCLAARSLEMKAREKRRARGESLPEEWGDSPWGVLVVAPLSVATQWVAELKDKVLEGYQPSVYLHHGQGRTRSPFGLVDYDVVVTTYGVLVSEAAAGKKGGPLSRVQWRRVFLDEAHLIRNHKTAMAKAALQLHAEKRWCLTGTTVHNTVDDLWTLFQFLQYRFKGSYPLVQWQIEWKRELQSLNDETRQNKFKELDTFLRPILLRRTKEILNLPPREIELRRLEFICADEQQFYASVQERAEVEIRRLMEQATGRNLYMNALYHLLRLRQACCHPNLVALSETEGYTDTELDALLDAIRSGKEKSVVLSLPCDMQSGLLEKLGPSNPVVLCDSCSGALLVDDFAIVVLRCQHVLCEDCSGSFAVPQCDHCDAHLAQLRWDKDIFMLLAHIHSPLAHPESCNIEELSVVRREVHAVLHERFKIAGGRASVWQGDGFSLSEDGPLEREVKPTSKLVDGPGDTRNDRWQRHSTKIHALLKEVRELGPGDKAIVFSNWTKMLDYCAMAFRETGVSGFVELTGPMSPEERAAAILKFSSDKTTKLILLSSAGNVGLNLVAANKVFIVEPWWSPAREAQVMDRAHRIGQTRPVHVVRFVVSDTVEERMLDIQNRKMGFIDGVHGAGSAGGASLTMPDLLDLLGISRGAVRRHTQNSRKKKKDAGRSISAGITERVARVPRLEPKPVREEQVPLTPGHCSSSADHVVATSSAHTGIPEDSATLFVISDDSSIGSGRDISFPPRSHKSAFADFAVGSCKQECDKQECDDDIVADVKPSIALGERGVVGSEEAPCGIVHCIDESPPVCPDIEFLGFTPAGTYGKKEQNGPTPKRIPLDDATQFKDSPCTIIAREVGRHEKKGSQGSPTCVPPKDQTSCILDVEEEIEPVGLASQPGKAKPQLSSCCIV